MKNYMSVFQKMSRPSDKKLKNKIPKEYVKLYKDVFERFLKQIKNTEQGNILLGDSSQDGGSLHSSVEAAANTHQFSEFDFDPENKVFMKNAIADFNDFMQAGGSVPLENLELLKQKTLTTQCRKYALNNKSDPLCSQFLSTIQELRAF